MRRATSASGSAAMRPARLPETNPTMVYGPVAAGPMSSAAGESQTSGMKQSAPGWPKS